MYLCNDFVAKNLNLVKATLHSSTNFGPKVKYNLCIITYVIRVTPTRNELFLKIYKILAKICLKYAKIPNTSDSLNYMSTLGKNRAYYLLPIC